MSEELAKRLGRNTVVSAGIHWDSLTDGDIRTISMLCQSIMEQITEKYKIFFA